MSGGLVSSDLSKLIFVARAFKKDYIYKTSIYYNVTLNYSVNFKDKIYILDKKRYVLIHIACLGIVKL